MPAAQGGGRMKAYSLSGDRMFPDPNGRWVHRENYDALAAAARKVTCWRCLGVGVVSDEGASCPDCAPLLEILNKVTAP